MNKPFDLGRGRFSIGVYVCYKKFGQTTRIHMATSDHLVYLPLSSQECVRKEFRSSPTGVLLNLLPRMCRGSMRGELFVYDEEG